MIRFDNVTKSFFGQKPALTDITVQIQDGDFVFLIGPSGAGKTTFLRLIIRDLLPTKGKVFVGNQEINILPVSSIHLLRRKIGTIFQDFKLLTDRTVFENIALVLEILGKPPHEIHQGVRDVLELVGLSDKANFFPVQLSAGEMQRTGIARAIVGGPGTLLADEPTGNLDPETSLGILHTLEEISKLGTTVVMATHNVNIVNTFKKRTIALHQGRLVSDEPKGQYKIYTKHKVHAAKHRI